MIKIKEKKFTQQLEKAIKELEQGKTISHKKICEKYGLNCQNSENKKIDNY